MSHLRSRPISLFIKMQAPTVEKLWHLFIPPIMTLLDDYEARYKLKGVQVVSRLLEVSPPDLLRRTGIDSLLLNVRPQLFERVVS